MSEISEGSHSKCTDNMLTKYQAFKVFLCNRSRQRLQFFEELMPGKKRLLLYEILRIKFILTAMFTG
jgi:hypothetical protein